MLLYGLNVCTAADNHYEAVYFNMHANYLSMLKSYGNTPSQVHRISKPARFVRVVAQSRSFGVPRVARIFEPFEILTFLTMVSFLLFYFIYVKVLDKAGLEKEPKGNRLISEATQANNHLLLCSYVLAGNVRVS